MTLHIPDDISDADPLTAALAYANAGWYVLPVRTGTKHPGSVVGDRWPSLSSRDPKTIAGWFAGTDHGIALHCGRSGAVVLDVDDPDNVPDEVAIIMESEGPYQATRTDQPGRGHYLLLNDTGRRIGNSLGKLATTKKWGEVRGANGVIIAEPTKHPDGGQYHWERTGVVPPIPDYLAEALPESATPEDTATDAEIEKFLNTHTETTKPETLNGLITALTNKLAAGHSCHMSTLGILTDAMQEAAAGYYPARTAARKLWTPYLNTVTAGTSTGRILTKPEAKQQYAGIVAWAIGQAETGAAKARERINNKYRDNVIEITPEDLIPPPPGVTLEDIEEQFWTARPELNLIYTAALSRMASPWATLACCAARIITQITPEITLPPIIGGRGSLNWFAAISAKSGGGKGAAMTVSAELVPEPINVQGIGSGEGMIETYRRSGEPEDAVTAVMFSVDEIDTIAAMRGRSGQTTMTILRQGFSGERLGFSYRSRQNESVAAHSYRMTLIAAVQPARAGALFDDAAGGTPQRFMWFPGRDRRITEDTPEWPTDSAGFAMTLPAVPLRDLAAAIGDVQIPDAVAASIKRARALSMSGDDNAMDGHSLFCREKFAYFLAVINGRTVIDDDDWKLSGIAAKVSDWCRMKAQNGLITEQARQSRERGAQRAIEKDECDVVTQITLKSDIARIVTWLIKTLTSNGPMKPAEIRRKAASRDRVRLEQALTAAQQKGLVHYVDGEWAVSP
jgi:hypothetical protein